ncbi:hypothetical protein M758_3G126100 [Ceratodon purpureus]|nr:hypothetical protein M758_3G126100 [Ceratodon purpureus]
MLRPSISLPFISLIAWFMAPSSAKVTNPKPRERPVSRSVITLLCTTSPKGRKTSSRRPSVVAQANPPTKHLNSSPIFTRRTEKKSLPK